MKTLNIGSQYQHQQSTFTIIRRQDNIVMAHDGGIVWEVFKIRNRKEANLKGYIIPGGEYPPSSEEFGELARCHTVLMNAEKSFREFIEICQKQGEGMTI